MCAEVAEVTEEELAAMRAAAEAEGGEEVRAHRCKCVQRASCSPGAVAPAAAALAAAAACTVHSLLCTFAARPLATPQPAGL